MALTAAEEQKLLKDVDLLKKKVLEGRAATSINKEYFEEEFTTSQTVLPSQILANEDLIPPTAAEVDDIVELNTDLVMNHIEGTDSFHHPDLEGGLAFNFGDGASYLQTLKKSDNSVIPFGQNDWHFDAAAGVLYFMNGLPDGVSSSLLPKITAYKYIGETLQSAKKTEILDSVLSIETDFAATKAGASYGDRFLVGDGAIDEWTGNVGKIATMKNVNFTYETPEDGGSVKVDDDDGRVYHHEGDWDNTFRWIRYSFSSVRIATTVGTDAYTASVTPPLEGLEEDHLLLVLVSNTNTGPVTIDTGFGVKNVKKYDPAGAKVALAAGDYLGGTIPFQFWDGVDYILFSGAASGGGADDDWRFVSGSTESDPIARTGNVNIGVLTDNGSKLYVEGGASDDSPVYVFGAYTGGSDYSATTAIASGNNAAINTGATFSASGGASTTGKQGVRGRAGTLVSSYDLLTQGLFAVGAGLSATGQLAENVAVIYGHSNSTGTGIVYGPYYKAEHAGSGNAIGIYVEASSVGGTAYIGQFKDGNQAVGKFIKCVTADGKTQFSVIDAGDITTGTFADARISQSSVTQHEAAINHDALSNYAVAQHRTIDDGASGTTDLLSASEVDSRIGASADSRQFKGGAATDSDGAGDINLTGEQTVNGQLTSTSIILLTEQTAPAENGPWLTAAGAWARPSNFNAAGEANNGDTWNVTGSSSTHKGYRWVLTTEGTITIDTTPLTLENDNVFDFGDSAGQAVEGTNTRMLSQDENDAAVGTNGTPSTSNKFVTNSDSRNTDSRDPNAHASEHTDGTDDIQSATNAVKGLSTAAQVTAQELVTSRVDQDVTSGSSPTIKATNISELVDIYVVSISAIDGDLSTGATKESFVVPYAGTIIDVRGIVETAPTGAGIIIDIHKNGTTIMTTDKIEIDVTKTSSKDAATQPTLTTTAVADGDKLSFDTDQVGSTITGAGGKVYVHIKRT